MILIQDAIDNADLTSVLDSVGNGSYQWYLNPDRSRLITAKDSEDDDDGRCVTGIIWNKEKYIGTRKSN